MWRRCGGKQVPPYILCSSSAYLTIQHQNSGKGDPLIHKRIIILRHEQTKNHTKRIQEGRVGRWTWKSTGWYPGFTHKTAITFYHWASPFVALTSDDVCWIYKNSVFIWRIRDQLDEDKCGYKIMQNQVGDKISTLRVIIPFFDQGWYKIKIPIQSKDTDRMIFYHWPYSIKRLLCRRPQTTDHPTYRINRDRWW